MIHAPERPSQQIEAPSPWKPCDLRGIYPDVVSTGLFCDIGAAVGTMLGPTARVVIAGDFRLSTPDLKLALSSGLLQTGAHVYDAGQIPTPLAYYAANIIHADAVLIVTASHNPAAHNGLKLMLRSVPTNPEQINQIRALTITRDFRSGTGKIETFDPVPEYMQTILARWGYLKQSGHSRVILDAGNGAWSELAPEIFRQLGFDVTCISCMPDGNFPDRSPDCSRAGNLTRLCQTVTQQKNSIGIAWDGDGDRVAFVDENGDFVSPDEIALLLASSVLEKQDKAASENRKIVVDIKCSDIVRRIIEQQHGTALLERTGHAFMRGRMVADNALLGLDACGHYFFQELKGGDDGLFAALFFLDALDHKGQLLSEVRRSLPRIYTTPELRIPTSMLPYVIAAKSLTSAFPDAKIMDTDGLRFIMDDGVVLVRESGTEPVVSLTIEGFHAEGHQRILSQCVQSLPQASTHLQNELQDLATR